VRLSIICALLKATLAAGRAQVKSVEMKVGIISYILLFAAPFFVAPFFAASSQSVAEAPKPAPDFALADLSGRIFRPGDYRGKVLLINFWATWCAPCRAEMPDLIRLQKEHGERGLQIVGFTYPPYRRDGVRREINTLKVNYPILLGTDKAASLYGVGDVLPVTIIIDREGSIRGSIIGILSPEEFDLKVKPLLY
jgi:thiol-disulfide isomerase/thioredoxin